MKTLKKKIIFIIIFCIFIFVSNVQNANAANIFGTISNWFSEILKAESTLDIKIEKDPENGLKALVTVTDPNSTIIKLKIKKVDTYDETVDFMTQGTEIEITPGNTVQAPVTVREEGIFKIAAINSDNRIIIATVIFYTDYFMSMELSENITNPGEIQINANDKYFNIVKLRIAKTSDITASGIEKVTSYFKDYGYGTDISINSGKTITTTYQVSENSRYTLYIEDEKKNSYAREVIVSAIPENALIPTIKYSTENFTNAAVTATISFNQDDVIIKNNNGSNNYVFNDNGEFIFEYENILGDTGTAKAIVTWIDKNPPVISNIVSGTTYTNSVTPSVDDKESKVTLKLEKNGVNIPYSIGQEISENGTYILTATDEAGNETKVNFIIKKAIDDSLSSECYKITTNLIFRVLPETKVSDFKNQIISRMLI